MSLITCINMGFRRGATVILDGVTLTLAAGERLAIVGRNGAGKSTLLNLIDGSLEPDEGSVVRRKGLRVGRLQQEPAMTPGLTVEMLLNEAHAESDAIHEALQDVFDAMATATGGTLQQLLAQQSTLEGLLEAQGGWGEEHRIEAVLDGVGLSGLERPREVRTLSGGERSRLELARVLLTTPDIMLLDEPTNHLDIDARRWLETFLVEKFPGAVVLVTHDRWLLQAVCDRVLEVHDCGILVSEGGWDQWRAQRAFRALSATRHAEKLAAHVRREEAFIRRYKAGQRAKQARGRASRLERFIDANAVDVPTDEGVATFDLPEPPRSGDLVMEAKDLVVGIGDKRLFGPLDLDIRRGKHIGIVGPNGIGKTTLLRTMLGEVEPIGGTIRLGAGLRTGWFRQDRTDVDPEAAVWVHIRRAMESTSRDPVSEQRARDLAGAFLLSGPLQDRDMGTLSGGERARAVFAGLLGQACNTLVLDEPTNHLDIPSAERIEAVLAVDSDWPGTLLLVSHDRALLQAACAQLLVLDDHGGTKVVDDVEGWLRSGTMRFSVEVQPQQKTRQAPIRRKQSPLQRLTVEQLEARIEDIESRLSALQAAMGLEENWSDHERMAAITVETDELQDELTSLEAEWASRS